VNEAQLRIEIVYAEQQRAIRRSFRLAPGSCAADALRLAALDPNFAGVDLWYSALGIFGRLIPADHALQDGDRLEIYRPLTADPKTARRARAKQARKKP
jgi:uncharacterized protein